MGFLRRKDKTPKPARLSRQLAHAALEDAMGRVQERAGEEQPVVPPQIHNPDGGTRSHYLDPDAPDRRPVCNASGARWGDGDGGLRLCGLCPGMWAQRQDRSSEGQVA